MAARPEDFSADGGTHEERASKAMMLEGDALPSAEIEQKWVGSENGKFEESWRDGGTDWFSSMHDSRRHAFPKLADDSLKRTCSFCFANRKMNVEDIE